MGLLSFFHRSTDAGSALSQGAAPADAVQQARTRARQRLIGAVVLVAIGVIGFPLVFETQPRPIPVDVPIELPRRDGAVPPLPAAPGSRSAKAAPRSDLPKADAPAVEVPAPRDDVITESKADAGREVAAPAAAASVAASAAERVAAKPATARPAAEAAAKKPTADAPKAPVVAAAPADSARAKALLDDKPADRPSDKPAPATPAAAASRFVVQVGAFAEADAARVTRLKIEKLGLKTYTQVAKTANGSRIRVRVGPFASREEADKALAKARGVASDAVVIPL